MDPILGMIILWPGNWIPVGWQLCDGTMLPLQQYAALYSLIGTTYGGNGTTTFAVPDLRSKVPMGVDARVAGLNGAVGKTTGATPYTSTASGSCSFTMTADNLPTHTHTATFTPSSGSTVATSVNIAIPAVSTPPAAPAPVGVPGTTVSLATTSGPSNKIYSAGPADTTLRPFTATGSVTVPASGGMVVNAATGNGHALTVPVTVPISVNTVQPSLYLNYIIATSGLYPEHP